MNQIQEEVARVVHESGNRDPLFAAGVEAANVWRLLGENHDSPGGEEGGQLALRSLNREVYRSFAEWYDYTFIIWQDMGNGLDYWRFTKHKA